MVDKLTKKEKVVRFIVVENIKETHIKVDLKIYPCIKSHLTNELFHLF